MDYPWALDNGVKCCKTYTGATPEKDLQFTDPPSLCENEDWIPCRPFQAICRSRVNPGKLTS